MMKLNVRGLLLSPAGVTGLVSVFLALWVIGANGWDPLALVQIGTRFSVPDPAGTEGYDGQFVYYIARDPNPERVAQHLDVPAYRYQRILLPLLARLLSFGWEPLIPWVIPLLVIAFHVLGTWAVSALLVDFKVDPWYSLIYGLWAGFLLAVRLDLTETLAYGLAAAGLLASLRGRERWAWALFAAAIFAKETAALFLGAQLAVYFWQRQWGKLALAGAWVLPFLAFQGWLWSVFGALGVGSGGAMATSFELIPFRGLLRVGEYSGLLLVGYLVVFGPSVVFPALMGAYRSALLWLRYNRVDVLTAALFFNSLILFFLPFSTYREPAGLLRFVCGLVLPWVLFWARERHFRVLNYSLLWLIFNVFLIQALSQG